MFVDELPQGGIRRVDELVRRDAAAVPQAGVGAGLEHHADERGAELALRGGLGIEPPDRGVEGGVALEAVEGVALEGGLVEEEVDDFVCAVSTLSQNSCDHKQLPPATTTS